MHHLGVRIPNRGPVGKLGLAPNPVGRSLNATYLGPILGRFC
jgi:hypothetical protein